MENFGFLTANNFTKTSDGIQDNDTGNDRLENFCEYDTDDTSDADDQIKMIT